MLLKSKNYHFTLKQRKPYETGKKLADNLLRRGVYLENDMPLLLAIKNGETYQTGTSDYSLTVVADNKQVETFLTVNIRG